MRRWRLSFPRVRQPFTGADVLVLRVVPIPIPGGGSPSHGEATCFTSSGQLAQLVVPLRELASAPRVHLAETRDERAPPGVILDAGGRPVVCSPQEGQA